MAASRLHRAGDAAAADALLERLQADELLVLQASTLVDYCLLDSLGSIQRRYVAARQSGGGGGGLWSRLKRIF